MKKVLVIGGGIIGQFSAYYLSKSGHEVTIIDDAPEMPPASAGNCGLITPSHIVPINSWGTIWKGLKWLGKRDAPLSIKPQFDETFVRWFLSFAWYSKKTSIEVAIKARHELLQMSRALYEEFFATEQNESEWKTTGMLYACHTEKALAKIQHEVEVLQKHNLEANILAKSELQSLEPTINDKAIGGAIFDVDGWIRPDQLLSDIRRINDVNGVRAVKAKVEDFEIELGKINKVNCRDTTLASDEYVLCAGAKSQLLGKKIGISLPMIPGKGYNLTTSSPLKNQPSRPVMMQEKMVVATPWDTGFRLGSTMEFSGFDLDLNESRLEALKMAATSYLNVDLSEAEFKPWAGWRPMTSNSLPIIERSKKVSNLIVATGHGILGLSMAPATGRMVKELVK